MKRSIKTLLLILLAIIFFSPGGADSMEFSRQKSVKLDTCSIWSVPVFDGNNLVVSCEGNGRLYAMKYDLDLNLVKSAKTIGSSSDFESADYISDHKHVFQNGYHYIVFSCRGSGSGGELVLIKLDTNLKRVGKVNVVTNSSPTNDMFLVGDGSRIYVGKYSPETGGHKVFIFSEGLEQVGEEVAIGGFDQRFGDLGHSNGAVALYDSGTFYLVAPNTLSPGDGNYLYLLKFDTDWQPISRRETIYEDQGDLGIVSGLVEDPGGRFYILNFVTRASGNREVVGPINAAVYDSNWSLISSDEILDGDLQRPHSVLVDDHLYIGYDQEKNGYSAYLTKFRLSYDESEFSASSQGQDNENDATGVSQGQQHENGPIQGGTDAGIGRPSLDPSKITLSITLENPPQSEGSQSSLNDQHGQGIETDRGSVIPKISLAFSGYDTTTPLADWWFVVLAPDGFLQLNVSNWNWEFIGDDLTKLAPSIQYVLVPLEGVQLPEFKFIMSGNYYFFFGLDAPDSTLNQEIIYSLMVKNVE